MKRFFVALTVGAMVFGVVYGAAATMGLDGGTIQAGVDADLTCDDAIKVDGWGYEESDGKVYFVRFKDIAAACEGLSMFVTVTSYGTPIATGELLTIPAGGMATVHISPQPLAADVTDLHVVVEGGAP